MSLSHQLILFLLSQYIYRFVEGCDNHFKPCNEGIEGTVCTTTQDKIIAYGSDNKWSYYDKTAGVNVNCDDPTFLGQEDPSSTIYECCSLVFILCCYIV